MRFPSNPMITTWPSFFGKVIVWGPFSSILNRIYNLVASMATKVFVNGKVAGPLVISLVITTTFIMSEDLKWSKREYRRIWSGPESTQHVMSLGMQTMDGTTHRWSWHVDDHAMHEVMGYMILCFYDVCVWWKFERFIYFLRIRPVQTENSCLSGTRYTLHKHNHTVRMQNLTYMIAQFVNKQVLSNYTNIPPQPQYTSPDRSVILSFCVSTHCHEWRQ